jgi:sirohydrochlorin cobaltochelatase
MPDERRLILLAHGSREPHWREPFDRLATELAAEGLPVELAFLELTAPDFPSAVARAVAAGAGSLAVLPLFFAGGAHLDRELPALVDAARAAHPAVHFELRAPIGDDPRLWALIKQIAKGS